MKATYIAALSFIIATVHAASRFDPIALGGHDETDEHPTSALVDFVVDTEASAFAGAGTVGKEKSLRGFKTASTRAQTRNASTEIEPIDAGGTVLGRGIRRARASARTHVGLGVEGGEEGNDKNSLEVGKRLLRHCSAGWRPQYSGGWAGGFCAFETDCNSPGYPSELACCKAAYSNQSSGYCLSKLEAPPTTSPTTSDFTVGFWYPDYETAWPSAGCLNTLPLPFKNASDRPNYSTHLECCRGAYAGQMSGTCLSQLESPPTTSPTNTGNTGSLYYPDYSTAWPDAGCINVLPIPSGRPTYTSHLMCCKGAYGGQMSGYCLSQLEAPPTTSPTSDDRTVDYWYPDYDSAWSDARCLNSTPLPFSPGDRPTYTTNEACCSGAYGSQSSMACLCSMESPAAGCPTPPPFPFTTNSELRTAVKEYLEQDCTNVSICAARAKYGGAIGDWEVSKMTDFTELFVDDSYQLISGAATFNEPINWDTGSAMIMKGMFAWATAFNQPLDFNTAKVTNMFGMFYDATAFNQDMCHFGDNWPIFDVGIMFFNSGCNDTNDPTGPAGPWCAVTNCP